MLISSSLKSFHFAQLVYLLFFFKFYVIVSVFPLLTSGLRVTLGSLPLHVHQ